MLRVRTLVCCSVALCLLCVASVHAEEDYARTGWYLGLAGATAVENFSNTGGESFGASVGLSARLGYRGDPHLAMELEGEWLEGFESSVAGGKVEIESWVITLNFKVPLLTGQIQPFGLAGVGVMEGKTRPSAAVLGSYSKDEALAFATRFGAGVDYYLTENVVLGADVTYLVPYGPLSDFDYVSIGWGVQVRF